MAGADWMKVIGNLTIRRLKNDVAASVQNARRVWFGGDIFG